MVTGATSQASWRLMPHSSSPDSSTAGKDITMSSCHGNTLSRVRFPSGYHGNDPLLLPPEATMTFSDEGAARRGSLNVVLIPQEVEESGGEESGGEVTREERTSTTFTISADHVLLT